MAIPALLGGAGLSLAAHELLLLTGDIFGISGFVHRSLNGNTEGLAGVAGLVVGGVVVAAIEGANNIPSPSPFNTSPLWLLLSGFLVGLGTKLANGCTSGHMICGISRLSLRSTAATATFFATASVAANIMYGDVMTSPISSSSWWKETDILFLQAISFLAVSAFYALIPRPELHAQSIYTLRLLTYFTTAVQFGLALCLADLTESRRVIGFLLPFRKGFDPSLLFVASSSIPLGILLYRFVYRIGSRMNEKGERPIGPRLGKGWSWDSAKSGIDQKLILGSSIFGFGWGLTGICPGTGVVNIGRALGHGQILSPYVIWTAALAFGGLLAEKLESIQ